MVKTEIKIPKGYKCKNGETCSQDLELEVEIPEVNPTVTRIPEVQVNPNQVQQQIPAPPQVPEPTPQPPQEKTYTNEELSNLMPPGVNYATCKGKNCADSKIQNKNMVTKFKECPKCGCNNVPKSSSMCPCCGTDEPTDEDDKENYWEESSIELESDD